MHDEPQEKDYRDIMREVTEPPHKGRTGQDKGDGKKPDAGPLLAFLAGCLIGAAIQAAFFKQWTLGAIELIIGAALLFGALLGSTFGTGTKEKE